MQNDNRNTSPFWYWLTGIERENDITYEYITCKECELNLKIGNEGIPSHCPRCMGGDENNNNSTEIAITEIDLTCIEEKSIKEINEDIEKTKKFIRATYLKKENGNAFIMRKALAILLKEKASRY